MTVPILVVLALAAAIAQIGLVPGAFAEPLAGPVLPVALLAGWAAMRRPKETWPVPLVAAIALGAVSEARAGMFVLALLPALGVATIARAGERRGEGTAIRRLCLAAAAGALGALCYVLILAVVAGTEGVLTRALPALLVGATWTALLATALAGVLWRVRTDSGGLFA